MDKLGQTLMVGPTHDTLSEKSLWCKQKQQICNNTNVGFIVKKLIG